MTTILRRGIKIGTFAVVWETAAPQGLQQRHARPSLRQFAAGACFFFPFAMAIAWGLFPSLIQPAITALGGAHVPVVGSQMLACLIGGWSRG